MGTGSPGGLRPLRRRLAVIDLVGLTRPLLAAMPRLSAWAAGKPLALIEPVLPALTCSMQSTYLTGRLPAGHGIVGNGWYFAEEAEIRFWRQCNRLVRGEKVWERARHIDPGFTCANLFWWYNMYSSVDFALTPRPMYPADGRKIPDIYTRPAHLRRQLQDELGTFPLFNFWGPAAAIASSRWIAAAARRLEEHFEPGLSLVYLPHLDYGLQRHGPDSPEAAEAAREIDGVAGELIDRYEKRGVGVMVLSEYGIVAVRRPVFPNRALRRLGWLAVRDELGRELLDPGASRAFAVADHQIAHIYVRDPQDVPRVRRVVEGLEGVDAVYPRARAPGLDHARAGDLVAVARPDAWFAYYYWEDEGRAPDFARTVDIHRKPGYDPAELFIDPALRAPRARIAWRLLQKALGLRMLMDVIPLDAALVRGSHGRSDGPDDSLPVCIGGPPGRHRLPAAEVGDLILAALFGAATAPSQADGFSPPGRDPGRSG